MPPAGRFGWMFLSDGTCQQFQLQMRAMKRARPGMSIKLPLDIGIYHILFAAPVFARRRGPNGDSWINALASASSDGRTLSDPAKQTPALLGSNPPRNSRCNSL